MVRKIFSIAAFLITTTFLLTTTLAQQNRAKFAVTDRAKADRDFAFQGEYLGGVSSHCGVANFGLQVVALGDGKFEAVLLHGGLPGAGWDRTTRTKLEGQRDGNILMLDGESHAVQICSRRATVTESVSRRTAALSKIHRISFTQDLAPPSDAVVLFNGTSTGAFEGGRISDEGLLEVGPLLKTTVRDFRLHLEFRTPYMPYARGQGRGNSGVYIQQRYEVQILDSFGLSGVANECGGLYKQQRPAINMCLPPLSWQTYDIYFTAARFNTAGKKRTPARITVLHNGELIHTVYDIKAKTGAGKPEASEARPILLQNHGNPVNFRNIWLVHGPPKSDLILPGYYPAKSTILKPRSVSQLLPRRQDIANY
ncbi:MAG TPA: DUF1080 domain-containing protein [Pirellulaceae bacterium]|nr:DUF1080 domain-containing protein [Pirellulaceae bacterium]